MKNNHFQNLFLGSRILFSIHNQAWSMKYVSWRLTLFFNFTMMHWSEGKVLRLVHFFHYIYIGLFECHKTPLRKQHYLKFIGNLVTLPLVDIVSINIAVLVLKIIRQCDIKHIVTLLIKTTSVLKVSSYIIPTIRLAARLAIMSVSTFKTTIIQYL